jgi:hypothetical protein
MKSFQKINIMQEEGGNHLPVPREGCPCLVEGPIPIVSLDTSNNHNQHIRIKQPHDHHHTYSNNTHVHIQMFHTLYNHTMNIIIP